MQCLRWTKGAGQSLCDSRTGDVHFSIYVIDQYGATHCREVGRWDTVEWETECRTHKTHCGFSAWEGCGQWQPRTNSSPPLERPEGPEGVIALIGKLNGKEREKGQRKEKGKNKERDKYLLTTKRASFRCLYEWLNDAILHPNSLQCWANSLSGDGSAYGVEPIFS